MNTETMEPAIATTTEEAPSAPVRQESLIQHGTPVAKLLLRLMVVTVGILIGAFLGLFVSLCLGWVDIAC